MAQTTTAPFDIEKARDGHAPALLLTLFLTSLTRSLANRRLTVDETIYEERISGPVTVEQSAAFRPGESSGGQVGTVQLELLNHADDATGERLSDLLASYVLTRRRALLSQHYIDANGVPLAAADSLPLIDGQLELPESNAFDDERLRLEILDGSDGWHKEIGTKISLSLFPGAPAESIGKTIPIIYGRVERSPAIPIDIGARSTLAVAMTDTDTTATLTDSTGFPASGSAWIDEEEIAYASISGHVLQGLTRGGSPIPHERGAAVVEIQDDYVFRLADHTVKQVHAVYVRRRGGTEEDWVRLDASEYTVEDVDVFIV